MQNALQAALVATGVAKPVTQNEMIWRVVKQDQPCDYLHIAKRTGIAATNVASLLGQMEKRDMVFSRGSKGGGPRGTRKEYTTDMETFKLLPLPKPSPLRAELEKRIGADPRLPVTIVTQPAPTVSLDLTVRSSPQAQIDALTVSEARELWGVLDRMFGPAR